MESYLSEVGLNVSASQHIALPCQMLPLWGENRSNAPVFAHIFDVVRAGGAWLGRCGDRRGMAPLAMPLMGKSDQRTMRGRAGSPPP